MKKLAICSAFVALAMALPASAATRQLVVSDPPDVSGPLKLGAAKCSRDTIKDPSGLGPDVARVKLCSWLIKFAPDSESNTARNYGLAWAQSTVKPLNGYCVKRVGTKIRLPLEKGVVLRRTPTRDITIAQPREKTVRLATNANGHSTQTGTAAQTFKLYPGTLDVQYKERDGRRIYNNAWAGKSGAKLGFATGLSMSWQAPEGAPTFKPALTYRFVKTEEGC